MNCPQSHTNLTTSSRPARGVHVDRFGAFASSLCALHCAVCALLPAAFGALGLASLLSHEAEWGFTLVAVVLAIGALVLGWKRHRSVLVAGLLAFGIVGLLASRGIEMGGEHHGHHEHHASVHATAGGLHEETHTHHEHQHEEHHEGHHDSEEKFLADVDVAHSAGAMIGVLAGLLLLTGHLLNIRTTQRCSKECGS